MQEGAEESARLAVERVFRAEYGALLAALIRQANDFELAEEALGDALAAALTSWPGEGTPDRPAAWLATVAKRRLIDRLRRASLHESKLDQLSIDLRNENKEEDDVVSAEDGFPAHDDRLRLIFTCCHPALHHEAQVALTLNTLCGLKASEIARSFLLRETAMAQRLVRAKQKIKEAGIPYRVPPKALRAGRLPAVLTVLYLVFNEGYAASGGPELVRHDLCREALEMARLLAHLVPEEPEAAGLLALMLLQDSRRAARTGPRGELVLLEDQDRSLWDAAAISEGEAVLQQALAARRPGPFQVQAAIAGVHARATRPADTDWREIVLLYDALHALQPSPVARLNRAVAVAMADGPAAGLALVEELDEEGTLESYLYLHATRADLLRRLDRKAEARAAYAAALALGPSDHERAFLEGRVREVSDA